MDYKELLIQNYNAGEIDMDEVISALTEFYETAGFDDFFHKVLAPMNDLELLDYYAKTFFDIEPGTEEQADNEKSFEAIVVQMKEEALKRVMIRS